jgi:hypothetical protein
VFRVPIDLTGAERARWLTELSQALSEAQSLLWQLGGDELRTFGAADLFRRIEHACTLVRSLQLTRALDRPVELSPEWINHPWNRQSDDVAF